MEEISATPTEIKFNLTQQYVLVKPVTMPSTVELELDDAGLIKVHRDKWHGKDLKTSSDGVIGTVSEVNFSTYMRGSMTDPTGLVGKKGGGVACEHRNISCFVHIPVAVAKYIVNNDVESKVDLIVSYIALWPGV